jgi:ferredoxin
MLVKIERDSCIGSGACVIACPEVFGQDDDGLVVLLNDAPASELQDRVVDASKACPASVIWTTRG